MKTTIKDSLFLPHHMHALPLMYNPIIHTGYFHIYFDPARDLSFSCTYPPTILSLNLYLDYGWNRVIVNQNHIKLCFLTSDINHEKSIETQNMHPNTHLVELEYKYKLLPHISACLESLFYYIRCNFSKSYILKPLITLILSNHYRLKIRIFVINFGEKNLK